jgi:hypothetical protein
LGGLSPLNLLVRVDHVSPRRDTHFHQPLSQFVSFSSFPSSARLGLSPPASDSLHRNLLAWLFQRKGGEQQDQQLEAILAGRDLSVAMLSVGTLRCHDITRLETFDLQANSSLAEDLTKFLLFSFTFT